MSFSPPFSLSELSTQGFIMSRLSKCLELKINVPISKHVYARGVKHYFRNSLKFKEMFEYQGGKCAICEEQCLTERELAVDHCHKTGKVRGLLCMRCNTALGSFKDDLLLLEKAMFYLKSV